jgi:hypothetical protein
MGLFDNIKNQDVEIKEAKDVLGGSRGPLDTDLYDFIIKMAYIDYAKSGAMSVVLQMETEEGQRLNVTEWVTSGDAKGNKNYYVDRKGDNQFLPGYININDICLVTNECNLEDMDAEEKVINVWDFTQRAEVPTQKHVLVDLLNQKVTLGVFNELVDKTAHNDATGEYEPTGETRNQNVINKVFHPEYGITVGEARMGAKEPDFRDRWVEKNKGQVFDRTKKDKGNAPKAGAPAAAAKPAKAPSLFK